LEKINYNIIVKQGCCLPLTLLSIYIDKLEGFSEEDNFVDLNIDGIVIILLIYVDDIVLIARSHYDLNKKLKILKHFFYSTRMTIDTNKMKIMIIKSKNITYTSLMYETNSLEEITPYKYLGIDLHRKLNRNYIIENRINGG